MFSEPLERPAALKLVRATRMLVVHEFRRYVRIPVMTEVQLVGDGRRSLGLQHRDEQRRHVGEERGRVFQRRRGRTIFRPDDAAPSDSSRRRSPGASRSLWASASIPPTSAVSGSRPGLILTSKTKVILPASGRRFRRTSSRYNSFVPEASTREADANAPASSGPRRFTLRQRIVLRIIIWLGYWLIRLIGPTLRVCISREDGAQETLSTASANWFLLAFLHHSGNLHLPRSRRAGDEQQ